MRPLAIALCLMALTGACARAGPTLGNLLDAAVSTDLGQPARAEIGSTRRAEGWIFVCGQPRQPDGTPIDYTTTTLRQLAAEGLVDDYFCALVADSGGELQLRELVVGSTDSPVVDWIETYRLPRSLVAP